MSLVRLALALTLILIAFNWMKAADKPGLISVKALSNHIQNVMWGH